MSDQFNLILSDDDANESFSQISIQTDDSFGTDLLNSDVDKIPYKDPFYDTVLNDYGLPQPLELIAHRENSADREEFVREFEENLSKVEDLDFEAENFIQSKPETKIYYANFEYVESKMVLANDIQDFQSFVTTQLKDEIERTHRQEAIHYGILNKEFKKEEEDLLAENSKVVTKDFEDKQGKVLTKKFRQSPDIFGESSDDENLPNVVNSKSKCCPSADLFEGIASSSVQTLSKNLSGQALPLLTSTDNIDSERRCFLINHIEDFILKFLIDLVQGNNVEFKIPKNTDWKNCELVDGILTLKDSKNLDHRIVSLKSVGSKFRISLIMFVLSEMYHLLIIGSSCTVRELYYQEPELTKSQTYITNAIRDICVILQVTPWEVGIHSAAKGLIAGDIRMTLSNDEVIDCSSYNGPTLLPSDVGGIKTLETNAKYLLIVEKATVFEMLLKQNILTNVGHDIILITGKGFPDINTRLMVKKIWTDLKIPIYALVDADPFGIEILFVYKYGSRSMVHNSDKLACPQINWIGIHPSEIESLAIPSMALNNMDKKRIQELLKRSYISDEIREELFVLQRKNQKAEIEGVSSFSLNFLIIDYIPNKIKRKIII